MNKFLLLTFLAIFTVTGNWAQKGVGIGTTNPQAALHISGNNASIRIDGLNSTNNTKNSGGSSMYNVMVDADGNLKLAEISGELASSESFSSPQILQTGADASANSSELYAETFTLTQRAFVTITYYISMEFDNYDGSAKLMDGGAKVAHNYWYLGNGVTPDTTKKYGMKSTVYSNSDCDTASGFIFNSRSVTLPLSAGNYSIHLNGTVDGGGLTSDAAFRVTFGDMDRLDISVMYF